MTDFNPSETPPIFLTDALTSDERDEISIYLGYAPNSGIIAQYVENFSPLFNLKAREYLWYLSHFDAVIYNFELSSNRDLIQVEDIKWNPERTSFNVVGLRDNYLSRLILLVGLQPIEMDEGSNLVGLTYI